MNRVLPFLPPAGPACHCDTCRAENRRRRLTRSIEAVEAVIGTEVVEYCLPSLDRMMQPEGAQVDLCLNLWPASASVGDDLAAHAARELIRIAGECLEAAERLDAAAGDGPTEGEGR